MLQKLHISNYAIIDELELPFPKGLNIITGETGAGKSILMGALGLVLGERADSSVLQSGGQKCVVEAIFKVPENNQVSDVLQSFELDMLPELIIRREITDAGKSRSFVNDTPVSLKQLRDISFYLVDLHQQFDMLALGEEKFQANVLDAIADCKHEASQMQIAYRKYAAEKAGILKLEADQQLARQELDYTKFLFDELEEISFKEDELELLDEELKLLSNAGDIKLQLFAVTDIIDNADEPITASLKSAWQKLQTFQSNLPTIKNLAERLNASIIELKDIATSIDEINDKVVADEARMEIVNDRIAVGYKLLTKHNLKTTAELLELKNKLQEKLLGYVTTDDHLTNKKVELEKLHKECINIAIQLHKKRTKANPVFCNATNDLLKLVGMPSARLSIEIKEVPLNNAGVDEVTFMFDANARGKFEPLQKVASGGELSRLMLCIKSLVAGKMEMPTLIFDEIDTGISGEAAKQVGNIMKDLSKKHQLIVISHQPQVAAMADVHMNVFKEKDAGVMQTKIVTLNIEQRIQHIAQMIGGMEPTSAALENAKELVLR